jgi:hypothetical protein
VSFPAPIKLFNADGLVSVATGPHDHREPLGINRFVQAPDADSAFVIFGLRLEAAAH